MAAAEARDVRSHDGTRWGPALLLGLLLGACSGQPAEDTPESSATLLITNVTVIHGSGSTPREDAAILVRGNRIAQVGGAEELTVPDGVPVYDGQGEYVIPGLWDMHTHALWEPFVGDGFLRLFLVNGVTGIRDMGGTLEVLQAVRPGGDADSPLNPRVVAAGPWLNEFVIDPRAGIAVETAEAAREAVASFAAAGVDFVKVYLHLPKAVFLAILEEARGRGLPVAGHVPLEIGSEEASGLGIRSIEHMRAEIGGYCEEVGEADCEALFSVFRRNGTWQTPTLLVRGNRALLDAESFGRDTSLRYAPRGLRVEVRGTETTVRRRARAGGKAPPGRGPNPRGLRCRGTLQPRWVLDTRRARASRGSRVGTRRGPARGDARTGGVSGGERFPRDDRRG
jgi:hypothetical protein